MQHFHLEGLRLRVESNAIHSCGVVHNLPWGKLIGRPIVRPTGNFATPASLRQTAPPADQSCTAARYFLNLG
jgi:hypothetical protein